MPDRAATGTGGAKGQVAKAPRVRRRHAKGGARLAVPANAVAVAAVPEMVQANRADPAPIARAGDAAATATLAAARAIDAVTGGVAAVAAMRRNGGSSVSFIP
jgi:hypothetical protein